MSRQHVDGREFRRALGCFATGVTVVTTAAADGAHIGLTVNSFNALSLDPPLVLWSIGTGSAVRKEFEASAHFAVNVLSEDQIGFSRRFATRGVHGFGRIKVRLGAGGAPLLPDCAAWFECRTVSRERHGDHVLVIGEVERFSASTLKPLLFLHGHYAAAGKRMV